MGNNGNRGWGHDERQGPSLIVKAAVKAHLGDKNVSSDFYDALDEEVEQMIEGAARRADANDRKTVQPRDL